MTRHTLLAVSAVLFASGCAPKFLVSDYFIPQTNKVVRATVQYSGTAGSGDDAADLVNYYMQVCDLNDGKATNCKTSLVLDNVLSVDWQGTGAF